LGNIYTDEADPIFISECKQKNKVSFNEDGTTIKSVTWTGFGAGSAGPMPDGIEVQLNQPFIYVIYDENDLPLYVGNVVNPSL
jgi:serine protease inhibitor